MQSWVELLNSVSRSILWSGITLLAACSSAKDATNENFQKAILAVSDTLRPCMSIPTDSRAIKQYPVEIMVNSGFSQRALAAHKVLVDAGLETARSERKINPLVPEKGDTDWQIFELTNLGKEHLYRLQSIIDSELALCFGTIRDLEVASFTEPAPGFKKLVTQVSFSYAVKDLPEWLGTKEKETGLYMKSRSYQGQQNATLTLAMTDSGWVDARSLERIPYKVEKVS